MNRAILSLFIIASILTSCVQKEQTEEILLTESKEDVIDVPTFKLYPTQNMWNFLKLNTSTGEISIVQYTVDKDSNRFEYDLNTQCLVPTDEPLKPGRFELTATTNRWNFILLDQKTGATYQVQWSFDEENRFVIPIPRKLG